MILSLLSLSHRWAAIWARSSLRASRSTAWKPSPTPPEGEILNFSLGNLRRVKIVRPYLLLQKSKKYSEGDLFYLLQAQQTHSWRNWGSWLVVNRKIVFISSLILFRTWGSGYFDTRWSGLGCPTLPHAPWWTVIYNHLSSYLRRCCYCFCIHIVKGSHQIKFCELRPNLSKYGKESVCVEISAPQVKLL